MVQASAAGCFESRLALQLVECSRDGDDHSGDRVRSGFNQRLANKRLEDLGRRLLRCDHLPGTREPQRRLRAHQALEAIDGIVRCKTGLVEGPDTDGLVAPAIPIDHGRHCVRALRGLEYPHAPCTRAGDGGVRGPKVDP
jgi:hypothetical protein